MRRRPLLPFTAIAALMLSAAAQAQEAPAAPPAAAAPAPARPSYSPAQMQNFARATVELQAQGSQDPAVMTRAIQDAGMSVEDYNQMGDAMRGDAGLASNLNPYLDQANADRTARIYASRPQPSARSAATPARKATASRKATTHKASSRHGRSTHKASHARTTKASHHTSKASRKSTTATRKKTSHASSSAAHKAKRHKRS